jgi:small subunit ribosomal protein S21
LNGKGPNHNVKIEVYNGDLNKAMRVLKKKLQREGIIREMEKMRVGYLKPSERRRAKKALSVRRAKQRQAERREELGM